MEDGRVIPDRVAEVLQGPTFLQAGTRDANLRPSHAHLEGLVVHDDRETITFFVHEKHAKKIVADGENNGRIAVTGAQISHEAYQVKGRYVSSRAATAEEMAKQEAYRSTLVGELSKWFPEDFVKRLLLGISFKPSVAITFRVEEVYLQTPGPDAGKKMV